MASHTRTPSEVLRFGTGRSALGVILVAASEKGVVAILIGENASQLKDDLTKRFPYAHLVRDNRANQDVIARVAEYIKSPETALDFPLDIRGTKFQKEVWRAVRLLKVGETITYTDLARKIGSPRSIRAVANACSINNIAFAIPCHRVLHTDRKLSFEPGRGDDRQRPMVAREDRALRIR